MNATALSLDGSANEAATPPAALDGALAALESEAVYILRETAAEFANPVLLFSGGKDSTVLLRLAVKAFAPGPMPFALMHVDTGHNFPEVIAFRDRVAAAHGARLIVASVAEAIAAGRVAERRAGDSRNALQAPVLLDAIEAYGIDACIGGARRDEEKARAKERVFSHRDSFGEWNPRNQRPELWSLFNARIAPGEHMRVFPISNWTELDVWRYIAAERIELPALYYAHERPLVRRAGRLFAISDAFPAIEGETVERLSVRFRTVGDISCTSPVISDAAHPAQVIAETVACRISERGATRADDAVSEASMELRKRSGYF